MPLQRALWLLVVLLFAFSLIALAQTETAVFSGRVTDPSGAVVKDTEITITNIDTNISSTVSTNDRGIYVFPSVYPGRYRLTVKSVGFKEIVETNLIVHVQDTISRNYALALGSINETVTVVADDAKVNTESATVGTVIDRHFVENLPLNGRSFNTLLQLTPGVVIAPANNFNAPGQFSIAGQRADANNFSVDGVSANFGATASYSPGQSGTGTAQAFSAIGGTSSLVSVEALQEFRIETSSFAPEFGRAPGGQVILTTRSGTNDLHGGFYEYFRNDVMDASDWFANHAGLPRAPERHNDFGGYVGGPIKKDKTFFFVSYEGARLRLPQTQLIQVPSEYARTQASTALAPFLNAFPHPNGQPSSPTAYIAPFTGSFSNNATLDAGSIRVDHTFNDRFSIFGRYNQAPSQSMKRVLGLSSVESTDANTRTLTVGANMLLTRRLSNALRVNYSTQDSTLTSAMDSFAGAVPLDPSLLLGSLPVRANYALFQTFDTNSVETGPIARNRTTQWNFVDDLSLVLGKHEFRLGGDYRAILLNAAPPIYSFEPSAPDVQTFVSSGMVSLYATLSNPFKLLTRSLSLYAQDSWKATPRLTLTYGLRWELSPAPSARGTTTLAAWENVDNPSTIALAPSGSPLWNTTYGNFAPRIGVAYSLTEKGDFVLRAGGGVFYDLGVGSAANVGTSFPNSTFSFFPSVPAPISDASPYLPTISLGPPYPSGITAVAPDLKMPRSYQWNVALEKSLRGQQTISATYMGQAGRDQLRQEAFYQPNPNFLGTFDLTQNSAWSNYDALQLQYRRPLSRGLQAILNYAWSHSLDNASNDVVAGLSNTIISAQHDYGSSDFDVRHSFSAAFTYAVPSPAIPRPLTLLAKDWSIDAVIVCRSGFPFNGAVIFASPGAAGGAFSRPDLVPGQPFWITNAQAPGGKSLNPNAFSVPPTPRQGSESRNDIPGFGLTQVDLSISRKFPITERIRLQFRADAFNVLNHPSFTNPFAYVEFGSLFLESTQMLNNGLAGLNPLFQQGGPRSLQLSLKLTF